MVRNDQYSQVVIISMAKVVSDYVDNSSIDDTILPADFRIPGKAHMQAGTTRKLLRRNSCVKKKIGGKISKLTSISMKSRILD